MKITLNNYEAYLADYFDGTLSETDLQELAAFLEQHPELEISLDEVETLPRLDAEEVHAEKTILFKTQYDWDKKILQDKMISQMEGELSAAEQKYLQERIAADPELQYQWELTQATRIKPDLSIVYPNKHLLMRRAGFFMTWSRLAAIAAMVAVSTGVCTSLLLQQNQQPGMEMAQVQELQNYPAPSPLDIEIPSATLTATEISSRQLSGPSPSIRYVYVERPSFQAVDANPQQRIIASGNELEFALPAHTPADAKGAANMKPQFVAHELTEWKGFVAKKLDDYTADVMTRDTLNAVAARGKSRIWSTERVMAVAAKTINKISDRPVKLVERKRNNNKVEFEVMSFD